MTVTSHPLCLQNAIGQERQHTQRLSAQALQHHMAPVQMDSELEARVAALEVRDVL